MMESLVATCRSLYERGYTCSSGGNVSLRTPDGMLMSATGTSFGRLDVDDFAQCDLEGAARSDNPRPSKEVGLHAAIYRRRSEMGAVVHLHSPFAIAFSTLVEPGEDVLPAITPYAIRRVGRVPMIEYIRPGTAWLAQRVEEVCGEVQAILLQNHGLIALGETLESAVDVAEELEQTCRIWLLTQRRGRLLTAEEVAAL